MFQAADSSGADALDLARAISGLSTPALLALIVIALLLPLVYPRKAFEREVARADKERDRADKLQAFVTDEMVPALTRATDALRDAQAETAIRRRQQ